MFQMESDRKVIIKCLLKEKTDARDIADRLQGRFDEHTSKLRTVQFWITKGRLDRQDLHDEIHTRRPPLDDLDAKILTISDKSPFEVESGRSMAEALRVAHSIVLLHLHDSISFRLFHLHWGPDLVTHDFREKREKYAKAILPFWHIAEHDGWHHLVTGDESRFFMNTSPPRIWTLSRGDVVTEPRLGIQSKQFMFTIISNPSSFYVIDRRPSDTNMKGNYFVIKMLIPLK
jgi:hypothetical protein